MHNGLIKLILNYGTTASMLSLCFQRVLIEKQIGGINIIEAVQIFSALLDFDLYEAQSSSWAPICFFRPYLTEEEERLIAKLHHATHTQAFAAPEFQESREMLLSFHRRMANWQILFWIIAPVTFILLILLVGILQFLLHVSWRHKFYKKSLHFYKEVRLRGFSP
jgi:hypothetical protein